MPQCRHRIRWLIWIYWDMHADIFHRNSLHANNISDLDWHAFYLTGYGHYPSEKSAKTHGSSVYPWGAIIRKEKRNGISTSGMSRKTTVEAGRINPSYALFVALFVSQRKPSVFGEEIACCFFLSPVLERCPFLDAGHLGFVNSSPVILC